MCVKNFPHKQYHDTICYMKKILIAEDDPFLADLAILKLEKEGYKIIKTADGSSVIPLLHSENPQLLILDIILPNQHGISILEEIRNTPGLNDVPVIIFSNETGPDIEAVAKKYKAHYFFKATTGTGELVEMVQKLLE